MAEVRSYVAWLNLLKAASTSKRNIVETLYNLSVENGGPTDFLSETVGVFYLKEEEIKSVLDGYLLPVRGVNGPQVVIGGETQVFPNAEPLPPGSFALGLDVPLSLSNYAAHLNMPPNVVLHDRTKAEALMNANALHGFSQCGTRKVNVVVVDGGMDAHYVEALGYSRSLEPPQGAVLQHTSKGKRPSMRHANGVARNVLALAPEVTLHDYPILPDRIDKIDAFTNDVFLPLIELYGKLLKAKQQESWVVVCAWGLLDSAYDKDLGTYTKHRGHLLSTLFWLLSRAGADIVFSAGNNGMFWPDVYSGALDRGPFHSIYGSNGLPEVLTVGAVDATGRWLGISSQGPEPEGLRPIGMDFPRKPDVCAPSGFRENSDRHAVLGGTSGACATAAGVVAAIRRRYGRDTVSQSALIDIIRATARRNGFTDGQKRDKPSEWRLGSGIIDCAALVTELERKYGS